MKLSIKIKVGLVSGVIITLACLFLWGDYKKFKDSPAHISKEGVEYTLVKGVGLARFSSDLYDKGIINSLAYFRWLAQHYGESGRLMAGEYYFPMGSTPVDILTKVQKGKVVQHSFTLIEGWNMKTLLNAIRQRDDIVQTMNVVNTPEGMQNITTRLNIPYAHPEGGVLPETYFFTLGMSDVQILKRAAEAMQSMLNKAWKRRDEGLLLKSPYEALILASLIEKETGVASERKQISGVFHRRLKKRMRLETDPTVIYGMGDAYQGNIKKKHLRTDTPYNTYTRHGLPPTPIALPSADAIEAALHPDDGEALYFVAKGNGSHAFSNTFKQHLAAVRRYQLRKRHAK